jgi:hypothetical protein
MHSAPQFPNDKRFFEGSQATLVCPSRNATCTVAEDEYAALVEWY